MLALGGRRLDCDQRAARTGLPAGLVDCADVCKRARCFRRRRGQQVPVSTQRKKEQRSTRLRPSRCLAACRNPVPRSSLFALALRKTRFLFPRPCSEFSPTTWTCPTCSTSIRGPFRLSTQPRTRIRLFSRELGVNPRRLERSLHHAPRNSRSKVPCVQRRPKFT